MRARNFGVTHKSTIGKMRHECRSVQEVWGWAPGGNRIALVQMVRFDRNDATFDQQNRDLFGTYRDVCERLSATES